MSKARSAAQHSRAMANLSITLCSIRKTLWACSIKCPHSEALRDASWAASPVQSPSLLTTSNCLLFEPQRRSPNCWSPAGLWLADGSGLIGAAVPELISAGTQIWYVSYPGGETRRITNDLNAYGTSSLGLTADSKTLVTVQADKSAQIWVIAPGEDESRAKQITSGKYDGDSITWTADGRVLYTAVGEHSDLWMVGAEGAGNTQLTADAYTKGLGCV